MRLFSHDRLAVLAFIALTAACSQPAESAGRAATPAPQQVAHGADAVDVDAEDGGAAGVAGVGSPGDLVRATQPRLVTMAAAMSAGAEFCGMSTRAQAAAGLPKMKARLAAQGGSPDEVERQYWAAYDATLAEARKRGPAAMKADCDRMRAMSSPAELRKWEQAARDMEELEARMKAQGH